MSPGRQGAGGAQPDGLGETTKARPSRPARPAVGRLSYLRDPRFLLWSARRAGRSSLVTARMLPGWAGMLPGFLIVGGQRCGTTSMSRALSQHPAVFSTALHQEVHYFDNAYPRGLAW
jgi:hypothetical protein